MKKAGFSSGHESQPESPPAGGKSTVVPSGEAEATNGEAEAVREP